MLNDFNELFTTETYSLLDFTPTPNIFASDLDSLNNSICAEVSNFELELIEPYDVFGLSMRKNYVRQKFVDITGYEPRKKKNDFSWADSSFTTFDRTELGCCGSKSHCNTEDKETVLEQSFISKIDIEPLSKRSNMDNCFLTSLDMDNRVSKPEIKKEEPESLKKVKKRSRRRSKNNKQLHTCKCTKSKCLRLYCECFAKGLICGVDCDCKDCHNNEDHKDLRELVIQETLEKNPKAFTSKYKKIQEKDSILHSRGCNCSKTGCVKEYCECYKAGTGCSSLCKCTNCQNHKIELDADEVRVYHDKVLRKRRKKSVLSECFGPNGTVDVSGSRIGC